MTRTTPKWEEKRMPEWRDGQPGCMGCVCELHIGMTVWLHRHLYYCPECAGKKRRKGSVKA
jgi:formamidopyrimidine-DNA glycosylase